MAATQKILWAMLAFSLCVLPLKANAKPWHEGAKARIVPVHNFRRAKGLSGYWKHRNFHRRTFQRPASPGPMVFARPPVQPVPAWGHDHWRDADEQPPAWYGARHEGDRNEYESDDDDGGAQNHYGSGYNGSPTPCSMGLSGNRLQRRNRLLAKRRADWAQYHAARHRTGQRYWKNQISYVNRQLANMRGGRSTSPNCYRAGYYGGYASNPWLAGAMAPLVQQFVP